MQALVAYDCDTYCPAAACATDPQTTITYRVVVIAEHFTAQELLALQTAIEAAMQAIQTATGGDHLCSVGDEGAAFTPESSPPPATPPPSTPPPSTPPPVAV